MIRVAERTEFEITVASYIFTALRASFLQGPLVAAAAFPLGMLMIAAFITLFTVAPLLLIIPFFGRIVVFLLTLVVWTAAARFAGSLAGLEIDSKPFRTTYWEAFPIVLVVEIISGAVSTVLALLIAELPAGGRLINILVEPLVVVVETVVIVLYLTRICCETPVRKISIYTNTLFALRSGFGILLHVCMVLLIYHFVLGAMDLFKGGVLKRLDSDGAMALISSSAYAYGTMQWLLAGILLAFEANLLAHAPRSEAATPLSATHARDLRAEWNNREP